MTDGLEFFDLNPDTVWAINSRTEAGAVTAVVEGEMEQTHVGLRLYLNPLKDLEGEPVYLYVAMPLGVCQQLIEMLVVAHFATLASNAPPPPDVVDRHEGL